MTRDQMEKANRRLRQENDKLLREIQRLKARLALYEPTDPKDFWATPVMGVHEDTASFSPQKIPAVHNQSALKEKIDLFRRLFQGRMDVYAKRWEGREKSGYIFACANDGVPQICHKPRVKCRECTHREYLPLTDEVIWDHLDKNTETTIGIYPLLHDDSCMFLAIDFDKKSWREDVLAFTKVCRENRVPAAVERSRSGNGAHVWIFFEDPVPASLARNMGSSLLTSTMEQRHQLGLGSYDRLFPNQDTMPKGGLGNLIALPLQGISRKQGNAVFVDERLDPYPDQWAFLSSLKKMKPAEVEEFVNEAAKKGSFLGVQELERDEGAGDKPWLQIFPKEQPAKRLEGPFPKRISIVESNMVYLEKEKLPPSLINHFQRMAAFSNPEFYEAQSARRPTYNLPRIISCSEEFPRHLALPRGCREEVLRTLGDYGIEVEVKDERVGGEAIQVNFHGELFDNQKTAVESLLAHETGVLSATTAFGKTVVAAWMLAARGANTLILVHRKQLLEQWKERIAAFLRLPEKDIGEIGGGKSKRTGKIDIALMQSIHRKGMIKEFVAEYGHVIVDECHHLAAFSFEQVMKKVKAKYVLGLTATPVRKDGHHPIIMMQCGPIRYRVDAKNQAENRPFEHIIVPRYTHFQSGESSSIQDVYSALMADEHRNDLIFDDVLLSLEQGRTPLVLTERTAHVEYFAERLYPFVKNVMVLRGGMGKKQLDEVLNQLKEMPDNEERVIIATGRFIGEGFDDPRLDTLFLAMPISWKGTLQQYAGRLHRLHPEKKMVQVYDYVDRHVPMLQRMYEKRKKGYENMGYRMAKEEEVWVQERLDI